MSSLRLYAPPCWFCASSSSFASRCAIVFSRRARAACGDLDRHLVGRAAHAAGADLEDRRERLDRVLEDLERLAPGALADDRERVVDDPLGDRLLAVEHDLVDHLLHEARAVERVGLDGPDLGCCAARHRYFFFTPYCERAFLRSLTPAASSVPRTTLYRTPGRSLTRPPRTSTTECSCRLWPSPGM